MRLPPVLLLVLVALSGCDSSVAADQGKNHRVQPGESLFSIAEKAYGNGLEWPRIWEANPWVDPDRLRPGELVFIPALDSSWGDPAPNTGYYAAPPNSRSDDYSVARRASKNPASGGSGIRVFQNLKRTVTEGTLFGFTLEKAILVVLLCFLVHSAVQSLLLWIAANVTFVKDVSFKKSMKAVFLTEMLTFTTLVVLVAVAILLVHTGTEPPASSIGEGSALFPGIEGFLRSPTGLLVAGGTLMALYITLSLRFLPQVFGVPLSHAITLMAIAILIPHLVGVYLIGQRTGLIH